MSDYAQIAVDIAAELAGNGVRFAHWKSNGHLREALAGKTDLDVLVHPDDAGLARHVFRQMNCLPILSQPWARYPGIEDWLVRDPQTGARLHLHVHLQLLTDLRRVKHLRLPWSDLMLSNLHVSEGGWPVPAPEIELLILLVRSWAKMPPRKRLSGAMSPNPILAELAWLAAQSDPRQLRYFAKEMGLRTAPGFIAALCGGEIDTGTVRAHAIDLNMQLSQHTRMPWALALLRGYWLALRQYGAHLRKRGPGFHSIGKAVQPKGAMIALVGSDGAGKSTLAKALRKSCGYKVDVQYAYMGTPKSRLKRMVRGLILRITGRNRVYADDALHLVEGKPDRSASMLSRAIRLLDLWATMRKVSALRTLRRLADGGSIVVLDRYPQRTQLAINDGPRQQNGTGFEWAAAWERRLFEEAERLGPDVVLKLVVSPEIAQQRKPDHPIELIREKCRLVSDLSYPQCRVDEIDADLDATVVFRDADAIVWSTLVSAERK